MAIIASHNTMTYRLPKQWWLRPFSFIAKCQSKSYIMQYSYGALGYDLRLFWDKDGKLEFRHGMFSYDASDIYDILNFANNSGLFVRLILENRSYLDRRVNERDMRTKFREFCRKVEIQYPNVHFWCGKDLYTWQTLYEFPINPIDVGYYSSVTSIFNCKSKILRKLDDWWPWLYARLFNRSNLKKLSELDNGKIASFDFIDRRFRNYSEQ